MHTHYDFSVQKYNRLKEMGFHPLNTLDIGASDGSWSMDLGPKCSVKFLIKLTYLVLKGTLHWKKN